MTPELDGVSADVVSVGVPSHSRSMDARPLLTHRGQFMKTAICHRPRRSSLAESIEAPRSPTVR